MPRIPLLYVGTVGSTMNEARDRLISGDFEPPFAVVANEQTDGRGRLDRLWQSPAGDGLYLTLVTTTAIEPQAFGLIAIAAGVAVCESLEKIGVSARLKWPNDLYIEDRKLGGILIQTLAGAATMVLTGLGLNLNRSDRFGPNAISVGEILTAPPEQATLAESLCDAIMTQLIRLEAPPDSVVHDWTARALWIGQRVEILAPEVVSGRLRGIDSFGRALIETQSGTVAVASGDLKRGPRPIAPPYTC